MLNKWTDIREPAPNINQQVKKVVVMEKDTLEYNKKKNFNQI